MTTEPLFWPFHWVTMHSCDLSSILLLYNTEKWKCSFQVANTCNFTFCLRIFHLYWLSETMLAICISMRYFMRMSQCLWDKKYHGTEEFQWLWEMNLIKIFLRTNVLVYWTCIIIHNYLYVISLNQPIHVI